MGKIKGWKKEERGNQINYIRLHHKVGEDTLGIIVIQKTPNVSISTGRITGYTYSLRTNKSYWRRFSNKPEAIAYATKLMREVN